MKERSLFCGFSTSKRGSVVRLPLFLSMQFIKKTTQNRYFSQNILSQRKTLKKRTKIFVAFTAFFVRIQKNRAVPGNDARRFGRRSCDKARELIDARAYVRNRSHSRGGEDGDDGEYKARTEQAVAGEPGGSVEPEEPAGVDDAAVEAACSAAAAGMDADTVVDGRRRRARVCSLESRNRRCFRRRRRFRSRFRQYRARI